MHFFDKIKNLGFNLQALLLICTIIFIYNIMNKFGMVAQKYSYTFLLLFFLTVAGCGSNNEAQESGSEEITSLPMQTISLNNLQNFRSPGENWSIAGNVTADYATELSMSAADGEGVLVNQPTEENQDNLFTELEHGDIELKLEFIVPKGSNSGIYFQGRYEAQILDSWRVSDPQFSDVGGIYERWDESMPDGQNGFEGKSPLVNASLAPGLWQEYRILFRAPKFDEFGEKTANARFEEVYLNGVLVQKNVEVTGPTRASAFSNEVAKAPLMIQGDHGPVAFRNIEYKLYEKTDSLEISPLSYKIYDYDGDRIPTSFEGLDLLKEGTTDSFNVAAISPKNEHYATQFTGELYVPVSGDYLFGTLMSNGGNLFIDGDLVLENTGERDDALPSKIINLEEGTYQLEVIHFQIRWGTHAIILYEGPTIEKRALASEAPWGDEDEYEPLKVSPDSNEPEIIGGFTNYEGEKRTHTLSVGFEEGIHYSYDLKSGAMLKFWRDPFADVSQMWRGRGHEQLLIPMNAAVEDMAGTPIILLNGNLDYEHQKLDHDNEIREYQLNENGEPIFHSSFHGISVSDHVGLSENGSEFIRTIQYESDQADQDFVGRIARSESIEKLDENLYRIGGRYYIEMVNSGGQKAEVIERAGEETLIIPILRDSEQTEIKYQIIW